MQMPRSFLTLALDGVSGQCHTPAAFYLGNDPWYPLDTGWVGPTAGLDTGAKEKTLSPLPVIKPQLSSL
jgi:hypothetical protein